MGRVLTFAERLAQKLAESERNARAWNPNPPVNKHYDWNNVTKRDIIR